jgi:hypothetical protein
MKGTKIIKTRGEIFNMTDNDNKSRVDPNYLTYIFQTNGNIWRVNVKNPVLALQKLKRNLFETKYILVQTTNNLGYLTIKINGKTLRQHRLLWEIFHGEIPAGKSIDHVNRIKSCNVLSNLRVASPQQQCQNKFKLSGSSKIQSKHKGVSWHKQHKKWHASICHPIIKRTDGKMGKQIYLGYYDNEDDARNVYIDKAKEFNKEYGCFFMV